MKLDQIKIMLDQSIRRELDKIEESTDMEELDNRLDILMLALESGKRLIRGN